MNKKTTKLIQAILLCLGYNNNGNLVADGDWGDNSVAAGEAYLKDRKLALNEGEELADGLLTALQDPEFKFDFTGTGTNGDEDLQVTQAYLITQGFDDDGKLNADGEPGPCTDAAAAVYLASLNPVETVQKLAVYGSQNGYFTPVFPADEPETVADTSGAEA